MAAHSKVDYAWDQPAAREKKIQLNINGARRSIDIMEIGDLIPFKFAVRTLQYLRVQFLRHKDSRYGKATIELSH